MISQLINEKVIPYGTIALSDEQLLQILLGDKGAKKLPQLLQQYNIGSDIDKADDNDVLQIASLPFADLKYRGNLTNREAALIAVSTELGIRIATASKFKSKYSAKLSMAQNVADYMRPKFIGKTNEEFWVLLLNAHNEIISSKAITVGTLTGALVDARAVFHYAIVYHAASVILCHNHFSSGNPAPSQPDKDITKALYLAGKMLNIPVLDHVILGSGGEYFSFSEGNLLNI